MFTNGSLIPFQSLATKSRPANTCTTNHPTHSEFTPSLPSSLILALFFLRLIPGSPAFALPRKDLRPPPGPCPGSERAGRDRPLGELPWPAALGDSVSGRGGEVPSWAEEGEVTGERIGGEGCVVIG